MIDADISKYFESIDHAHLRSFLDPRIKDCVIRRMIDKWLKAGVLEQGILSRPMAGTPQGSVISPLLANIFLRPHYTTLGWLRAGRWIRRDDSCKDCSMSHHSITALSRTL